MAIRLPTNSVLQGSIEAICWPSRWTTSERGAVLLPANFTYQAGELVETAPGDCQGRMASGRTLSACRLYSHQHEPPGQASRRLLEQARSMRKQWIKKARARSNGRDCHVGRSRPTLFDFNFTRSPYNLGNFLRTLATPEPIKDWSMTSLKEKLIKIGLPRSCATYATSPSRWPGGRHLTAFIR